MTWRKMDGWPLVLPNDDGIRPAGPPGACLYCRATIGSPHGPECVCVSKLVRFAVEMDGVQVGTWDEYVPHAWDTDMMEFARNEGSWCADNALDGIDWADKTAADAAHALSDGGEDCCCSLLGFRFVEVLDDGPLVRVMEEVNNEQS